MYDTLGLPRGYWEDLKYYTNNNHPLAMMLFADPLHPYSARQRRFEFLGAFVISFAGAGYLLRVDDSKVLLNIAYSLIYVTIPTVVQGRNKKECNRGRNNIGEVVMLCFNSRGVVLSRKETCPQRKTLFFTCSPRLARPSPTGTPLTQPSCFFFLRASTRHQAVYRKIAYFLFVAPCFLHDKSKTSKNKSCCLDAGTMTGAALGYAVSLGCAVFFAFYGFSLWREDSNVLGFVYWFVY